MTTGPVRRVHGPRRANRLFTLGSFAFLIVAGWLLWGRTLGHEFVWDDNDFIVRNAALRSWTFLPQYFTSVDTMAGGSFADQFLVFRPLRNVSYRLDFAVAGLNPRWWHATNVWLHVLNALLLYLIARTLMTGPLAPLFAASIFLLHPVQSEVVCWIKARDDLLAAAFSLGLILVWVRWRSPARSRAKMAALALLYLGHAASLSAQQDKHPSEGKTILGIEVEGAGNISKDKLLNWINTRVVEQLSSQTTRDDCQRIYRKFRLRCSFDYSDDKDGKGIWLLIRVEQVETYDRIVFQGLKHFEEERARNLIGIGEDQAQTLELAKEQAKALERRYRQEGFAHAEVNVRRGKKVLTFVVDEGPYVRVKSIR
ncbi:hypothetical protein IIC65_03065, partial [Candidatus Sumerlaeota bacterium]|nr:hypothetical protein [Candidatus Sumerlaeota bacterium]